MKTKRRFDFVEKAIYTDPIAIELDFVSPHMRGSSLKRVDNERLVINQLSVGWIELLLAALSIFLYIYGCMDKIEKTDELFKKDKKIATAKAFYDPFGIPDTIRVDTVGTRTIAYCTVAKRKPNRRELEIITRYEKLGEEGYRKYLRGKLDTAEEKRYTVLEFGLILTFLIIGFPRRKRFIFDRKAGTVTYPRFMGIGSYKLPFQEVNFIYARAGMYVTERKGLAILRPNGVGRVFINFQYPVRFLSFYVWYMDKNRPLPPGTAFDPYRELDYESRKAAGFPPPLYPSLIETPE